MTLLCLALLLSQDPPARSAVGAAKIGSVAYIVGGSYEAGGRYEQALLSYDLTTKTWKSLARLPEAIAFPAVAAHQGRLYVFGGLHPDGTACGHSRLYDPGTDRWYELANLPTPRSRASCTVVQGKLAVIGGIAPEAALSKNSDRVELYDPEARTWSRLPSMPTARHGHVSAFVKDRLVVAGGFGEGQYDTVEVYDLGAGWTKGAPMPEKRGFAQAVVFDNLLWVFGNRGPAPHPVRYDATTDKWTASAAEDNDRHRGAAIEHMGKAYFFFGEQSRGAAVRVFDLRRDAWLD